MFNDQGHSLAFVDIDETLFRTFAKVAVRRDGEVVRWLDNQTFNTDVLQDGEEYDFGQFRDADLFRRTSRPIPTTMRKLRNILGHVSRTNDGSRIVFLTARSDFDDKETFLQTFRDHDFDIDSRFVYVERSGNLAQGTVAEKKRQIVLEYISSGHFRRVWLFDDDHTNLRTFLDIQHGLPERIIDRTRHFHDISRRRAEHRVIEFVALHVDEHGRMRRLQA